MRSLDPTEDFAITLVRRFLVLCEHPRTRDRMLRIVARSMQPGADAPRIYRWLNRAVLLPRMQRGSRPMSAIKWELVASQLFAIATMRYLLELEPIASASRDDVVTMASPGVLAVLQGTDVFAALVVDEPDDADEDLSDLGDLAGMDDVDLAVSLGGSRRPSPFARRRRGAPRAPGEPI